MPLFALYRHHGCFSFWIKLIKLSREICIILVDDLRGCSRFSVLFMFTLLVVEVVFFLAAGLQVPKVVMGDMSLVG